MLASACIVMSGRSREWQDRHDGWCYFSALLGQFSAMASMGWSFSIVIDLLLIVCKLSSPFFSHHPTVFPLQYGRKKKKYLIWYHYLVWGISSLSCIPAVASGNVGMSTDGTCWFLGNYVWCFWVVWYMFVGFSIPGIFALYLRLRHFHETTDSVLPSSSPSSTYGSSCARFRCHMCGSSLNLSSSLSPFSCVGFGTCCFE